MIRQNDQGPNVKKLIAWKMSRDAVPSGGGLADALEFLTDQAKITAGAKAATEWVYEVILAVRCATEPNPYKNASEEEIARVIIDQIEKRHPRI